MQIPQDFPDDAPLPDGRPRCDSRFGGRRCVRRSGHEHEARKNPRHHIGADQSRWTVGRRSRLPQRLDKCSATYGEYRCDRWPHVGYHGVSVGEGERIGWVGSGAEAVRQGTVEASGGGGLWQHRLDGARR